MWKRIVATVTLALLIGSSAGAGIVMQDQGLLVGFGSGIDLLHGDDNGSISQTVVISTTQDGTGVNSLFGNAHLLGISSSIGNVSNIATMTGIANGLLGSGLVSPWTANSLGDQARLHLLMLSVR
jgi:hypothetical protein